MRYLQGSLDKKAYDAKIWSMAIFHNSATMAHQLIACTMTALVAATREMRFMAPVINMELMNTLNNPSDAELQGAPAHSEHYQSDVQIHCGHKWVYLLKLLQYWHDANSLYEYGGPVWTEGKLMLFIFYHVNKMLNQENLYIWLCEVMDGMPWCRHYIEHHSKEDHEAYFGDHVNIIQGLEHLRNWVKNWYLAEACETWHHLKVHSRNIDCMPYPRSYEDQHPGNECVFYRNWGATIEDVEIRPENAPRIANVMIEALAWHNCWQKEARDCQEYQRQLDSTALPGATFPLPRAVDRDVITELDSALLGGVEGATADIPEKKKITLDEYNCCKALKLQKMAASPDDLDENGERLDYDDFEPE